MTYVTMQHIPLTFAYLCGDCNSIGNNSQQCPACASAALMSLAGVLGREDAIGDTETAPDYAHLSMVA